MSGSVCSTMVVKRVDSVGRPRTGLRTASHRLTSTSLSMSLVANQPSPGQATITFQPR